MQIAANTNAITQAGQAVGKSADAIGQAQVSPMFAGVSQGAPGSQTATEAANLGRVVAASLAKLVQGMHALGAGIEVAGAAYAATEASNASSLGSK